MAYDHHSAVRSGQRHLGRKWLRARCLVRRALLDGQSFSNSRCECAWISCVGGDWRAAPEIARVTRCELASQWTHTKHPSQSTGAELRRIEWQTVGRLRRRS